MGYSLLLLLSMLFTQTAAMAADTPSASDADADAETQVVKPVPAVELPKLQQQLDNLKQQVSQATSFNQIPPLTDATQKISVAAQALKASILPDQAQVQAQLDILGPPPAAGAQAEAADVANQRKTLIARKAKLDALLERAQAIVSSTESLSVKILNVRQNILNTQRALSTSSILSARFWRPMLATEDDNSDQPTLSESPVGQAWQAAWQPEWRKGSAGILLLAVVMIIGVPRLFDNILAWFSTNVLPEGRLRRSLYASCSVLVSVVVLSFATYLLGIVLTRPPATGAALQGFVDDLNGRIIFSAMIAGLGRSLLSNSHPSWRLPVISDPVAQALRPFPYLLAICTIYFGTHDLLLNQAAADTAVDASISLFYAGISSLLFALIGLMAMITATRVRRQVDNKNPQNDKRSFIGGLLYFATLIALLTILFALLTGYITFALYVTYEMLWFGVVLATSYLLRHLFVDFCSSIFSPSTASGRKIKQSLNFSDRNLQQAESLLSGILKIGLILFTVLAMLQGTFGTTTPHSLLNKMIEIWGGKGLEQVNIVPAQALNAVLCFIISTYALRSGKRWLDKDFLPKTKMDAGMRVSLVTLFTNLGYVLVILLTLSTLGIQWNKLAWIVSALSVGIGFGLQEIVKNFISGIILLTERPVKVGDLISISGVEGDIRRINVRATEIQLGDRSTVIVPNSQLISQNVRNATMGGALGVVTIALTFPLNIDPEQVRSLLIGAYEDNEAILPAPVPSVKFSQLSPEGIVLSVTGIVGSPRTVSGTKSDLLFEILKRLRAEGISLSSPQTMILERNNNSQQLDE